jgi:hypothetical protein
MLTHLNITVYFAPACASYDRIKTEGGLERHVFDIKRTHADPGQYQDGGKFDQVHADMRRKRFGRTGEGTVPEPGEREMAGYADAYQTHNQHTGAIRRDIYGTVERQGYNVHAS